MESHSNTNDNNHCEREILRLKAELAEVHKELHETNSELMQLTLELDAKVEKRTQALQRSESELRKHRDHLQEMVDTRTRSLRLLNEQLEKNIIDLAISEEKFRSLVATIPDIVYRIDQDGQFTFVNNAITKLGYQPAELLNQHFTRIISENYHGSISHSSLFKKGKTTAKRSGPIKLFDERRTGQRKTTGLEIELLNNRAAQLRNGTFGIVHSEGVLVEVNSAGLYSHTPQDNTKTYIGTVGVMRDITNRKVLEKRLRQANEELEHKVLNRTLELTRKNRELLLEIDRRTKAELTAVEAKQQWQEIFEAIGHTSLILDAERTILAANRSACSMTSKTAEELIGKKCYTILHNRDTPIENCPFDLLLQKRDSSTTECEVDIGERCYIVSCTPVYDDENELRNVIHIATDITAIKKLEKDLLQAQKMESLGTLAGGIAHDFNNILSIIIGYSELAASERSNDEELLDYLEQISKAGVRARDLIRQILTFARRTDDKPQPIQVDSIAKETIKLLRSTTPSSIEISSSICSTFPVHASPTHIHQILMNLITNGCQALVEEKGRLELKVHDLVVQAGSKEEQQEIPLGSYVLINVSDTGIGISKDQFDLIFEPYFTTKSPGEGTGLGLSVVHGIVHNCKGRILVDSVPGKGTTFTVYLPASNLETSGDIRTHGEPIGGSEHIYVIDDEPVIAKMTCRLLQSLGYRTTASTSSPDALQEILKMSDCIDLVLTDVTMPLLSGDSLAEELFRNHPKMPVILTTGFSRRLNKERIRKIGVKKVVMKPLQRDDLARVVRSVLDEE